MKPAKFSEFFEGKLGVFCDEVDIFSFFVGASHNLIRSEEDFIGECFLNQRFCHGNCLQFFRSGRF